MSLRTRILACKPLQLSMSELEIGAMYTEQIMEELVIFVWRQRHVFTHR
jgi:hypothetical protein